MDFFFFSDSFVSAYAPPPKTSLFVGKRAFRKLFIAKVRLKSSNRDQTQRVARRSCKDYEYTHSIVEWFFVTSSCTPMPPRVRNELHFVTTVLVEGHMSTQSCKGKGCRVTVSVSGLYLHIRFARALQVTAVIMIVHCWISIRPKAVQAETTHAYALLLSRGCAHNPHVIHVYTKMSYRGFRHRVIFAQTSGLMQPVATWPMSHRLWVLRRASHRPCTVWHKMPFRRSNRGANHTHLQL